jgi:tetratricopeptide (TPR) repeat protein
LGDYYLRLAHASQDINEKQELYDKSIDHYKQAIEVATNRETDPKVSYIVALGNIYIELANNNTDNKAEYLRSAIEAYLLAIETGPRKNDIWKIEETLSRLFAQLGEKANALDHAKVALEAAPASQKEKLQTLITQIQALP